MMIDCQSRRRRTLRPQRLDYRSGPVRRIRPAPDRHYLRAGLSVQSHPGGRSGISQHDRCARQHLFQERNHPAGSDDSRRPRRLRAPQQSATAGAASDVHQAGETPGAPDHHAPKRISRRSRCPSISLPGVSLGQALDDAAAQPSRNRPAPMQSRRTMVGSAAEFVSSLKSEPFLIARRDHRRLHRARRALRKLHPPHHHSVDTAVCRHRRPAGDDAVPSGPRIWCR